MTTDIIYVRLQLLQLSQRLLDRCGGVDTMHIIFTFHQHRLFL